MRKKIFEHILGKEFLETVPKKPGVYRFLNKAAKVIYVGKAKDLHKRLQQYTNITRKKKKKKQIQIIRRSTEIQMTVCKDETEALLLENRLIQKLRPTYNIEGAFSFMYPIIGFSRTPAHFALCYTTSEKPYSSLFQIHGAFRSREITRAAFIALKELLSLLGHQEKNNSLKEYPKVPYSSVCAFRQLNPKFDGLLREFLLGKSSHFLVELSLALLEKPGARSRALEVKEQLKELSYFFKWEALPLRNALKKTGNTRKNFVPQSDRDALFIRSRFTLTD